MTQTQKSGDLHCRVPAHLWTRLKDLQERMSKKAKGAEVTITAAVLKALEEGLEALNA